MLNLKQDKIIKTHQTTEIISEARLFHNRMLSYDFLILFGYRKDITSTVSNPIINFHNAHKNPSRLFLK